MRLDRSLIQAERFNADANNPLQLQLFEDRIEHAALDPAIHAHIDPVTIAKSPPKSVPSAAMLGEIKNRVQHLQVAERALFCVALAGSLRSSCTSPA